MRSQIVTEAIVLARTDFAEADRIVTLLTPDNGKLKVIAKGVRRPKSKLAGGIELLSVSNVTVLPSRGDIGTLISSRLMIHYGEVVKDIRRTMLAYDFLKRINRATEDAVDEEYYLILNRALESLNDLDFSAELTELWIGVQLLNVSGHMPNLQTDSGGQKLTADKQYVFDFENMSFREQRGATFTPNHIKILRASFIAERPLALRQIVDAYMYTQDVLGLVTNLIRQQIRH